VTANGAVGVAKDKTEGSLAGAFSATARWPATAWGVARAAILQTMRRAWRPTPRTPPASAEQDVPRAGWCYHDWVRVRTAEL